MLAQSAWSHTSRCIPLTHRGYLWIIFGVCNPKPLKTIATTWLLSSCLSSRDCLWQLGFTLWLLASFSDFILQWHWGRAACAQPFAQPQTLTHPCSHVENWLKPLQQTHLGKITHEMLADRHRHSVRVIGPGFNTRRQRRPLPQPRSVLVAAASVGWISWTWGRDVCWPKSWSSWR